MGYKLRRGLAESLPDDCTTAERLVALEIADRVWDNTRKGSIPRDDLARWTGLRLTSVKTALARLATQGLELRVTLKLDKLGRPVYAYPGASPQYRVPDWVPLATDEGAMRAAPSALRGDESGPLDEQGATRAAARGDESGGSSDESGPITPPLENPSSKSSDPDRSRSPDRRGAVTRQSLTDDDTRRAFAKLPDVDRRPWLKAAAEEFPHHDPDDAAALLWDAEGRPGEEDPF